MLLNSEWAKRFTQACGALRHVRRRSLAANETLYLTLPVDQCWIVAAGYVKLIDPLADGNRLVRLILGPGGLFGDRPFGTTAFRGFAAPPQEQAISHGPAEALLISRDELETAAHKDQSFAELLLQSSTTRAQFLERRLLWQCATPVRTRVAMALRDLICFEGDRCRHGHAIDIRLTHQDLAELIGMARPVVSAELVRLRNEGLIAYTRSYFCVDDLAGLDRLARL
ncbi:MAG: Crp/Fnr family transcriptional regulator [Blastopirellula sp. JB062]